MSQSVVDVLEEQSVVASLQPGPKGTVRVSYEYPHIDLARHFLEGFAPLAQMQNAYVSPPGHRNRSRQITAAQVLAGGARRNWV
jgi:hypothetical protein